MYDTPLPLLYRKRVLYVPDEIFLELHHAIHGVIFAKQAVRIG